MQSEEKLNNLLLRTITGAIYVIAVVGAIYMGPVLFAFVIFVINLLMLNEFYTIIQSGHQYSKLKSSGLVFGSLTYLIIIMTGLEFSAIKPEPLLILIPLIVLASELFRKNEKPLVNSSVTLLGVIYISIPLAILNLLFLFTKETSTGFPWILLGLFAFIWINDTFSYLTGILLGRHKLFERISPKKTWEGAIGGFLFSLAGGYAMHRIAVEYSLGIWLVMAGLTAVSSVIGDLTESMIKRSLKIKDSGNLLPGHGGVLDRFDSLLFAAPVVYVFLTLLNQP